MPKVEENAENLKKSLKSEDQNAARLLAPLIFNYLNYREYLKDFYKFKKASQRGYSYAMFSARAGIKSPNYLKLVMDGARNLTPENALKFAKALSLNSPTEVEYWQSLVEFNQTRASERKHQLLQKLAANATGGGSREIRDEWEMLSSWHHLAIRELVLLNDFNEDPVQVANSLGRRISVSQARESLELLVRTGFLVRNEKGRLTQAQREIRYFSKSDLSNLAIQRFHRSTGELALKLLTELDPSARDFSGLTIAIDIESLPLLKSRITEFRRELNREFSTSDKATKVMQLNLQLFPLSR